MIYFDTAYMLKCYVKEYGWEPAPNRTWPRSDRGARPARGVRRYSVAAAYLTGLYGAFGVMLALRAREKTGRGEYIDIALHDGIFRFLDEIAAVYDKTGHVRERNRTVLHRSRHCAIGRMSALSLRSRKLFLDRLSLLFEAAACNMVSILLGDVLKHADSSQQRLKRLSPRLTMLHDGHSTKRQCLLVVGNGSVKVTGCTAYTSEPFENDGKVAQGLGRLPMHLKQTAVEDKRFLIGRRRCGQISGLAPHISEPVEADGKVPQPLGRLTVGVHKTSAKGERFLIGGRPSSQLAGLPPHVAEPVENDGKVAQCLGRLTVGVHKTSGESERFLIGGRPSSQLAGLPPHVAEPVENDGKVAQCLGRLTVGVHKTSGESERFLIGGRPSG